MKFHQTRGFAAGPEGGESGVRTLRLTFRILTEPHSNKPTPMHAEVAPRSTSSPTTLYGLSPALWTALVIVAVGAAGSAAWAQETSEPVPESVQAQHVEQEIIELPAFTVEAQKTPRSIQDVPMAVVAIDTGKVADFKIFSVQEIQNVSPGLNVNTVDARNPVPSMRGVTFNPDSGTTAAVDVYWNETAVSASTAFRAMYDVGQIEVLRGPQGTLRGRSSPGGAITIASRKPDLDSFQFSAQQSLSDQSLVNTQLAVNAPIVAGKLALRLAGLYDGNEAGGIHNVVLNKDSSSHTRSARATLEWKPTENFDLTLVHQVLEQQFRPWGVVQGSPVYSTTMPRNVSPFDRISANPGPMEYDDKPVLSTLTAVWRLPRDHELTAIVGLQKTETNTNVEFDNDRNIIPGWSYPQQLDIDGTSHTYELRFASVKHDKWNYIFGAYYEDGDSTVGLKQAATKLWFDGPNPFVSTSPTPRAPDMIVPLNMLVTGDTKYRGVFTTQTFQLTEKLGFEAGVRYQQIKNHSLQSDPSLGINSPTSRDEKPTTGSASLTYKLRRSVMLYATAGRSYRPGGEGFRNSAEQFEKYLHYRPEKSNGVELGVKSSWLHNRLHFNAAVFHQTFKDYISHSGFVFADLNLDGISDNVVGITFNGDARTQGVEMGMAVSLPRRVIVNLDATYVDARWTDARSPSSVTNEFGVPVFNTPGEQVSYINLDGKPLGDTPHLELTASIDWTKKVRSVELFTRGLFRYKGNRELLNVPNPDIGGYGMVDLFAGVRQPGGRWGLTFWAKNALDREVVTGRDVAKNIGLWSSGYTGAQVAPQRELGVTASLSF